MNVRFGFSGPLDNQRMVEVRNDSGETIPAFGIMRKTGHIRISNKDGTVITTRGRDVLTVDKPNNYASQGQHLVNGPVAIEDGKFGYVFPFEEPFGTVALDPDDPFGLPAQGEIVGPVNASWYAYRYAGGFRVMNVPEEGDTVAIVTPAPMLKLPVKLTESLLTMSSAEVNPRYHDGSAWKTNLEETFTVHDILGTAAAIPTTQLVWAEWEQSLLTEGGWIASSAGCNVEVS